MSKDRNILGGVFLRRNVGVVNCPPLNVLKHLVKWRFWKWKLSKFQYYLHFEGGPVIAGSKFQKKRSVGVIYIYIYIYKKRGGGGWQHKHARLRIFWVRSSCNAKQCGAKHPPAQDPITYKHHKFEGLYAGLGFTWNKIQNKTQTSDNDDFQRRMMIFDAEKVVGWTDPEKPWNSRFWQASKKQRFLIKKSSWEGPFWALARVPPPL